MNAKPYVKLMACGLLAIQAALLTGCGSAPKPTLARISVDATADVNPDARGRASPIVVRFLELKSLAGFEGADFFSLYDRDRETLGAELLSREEFQMTPGSQQKLERKLNIEARYIGVVAAFRDLERAQWRAVAAVPSQKTVPITIKLDARTVSIRNQ